MSKKILSLVLVLAMILSMSACADNSAKKEESTTAASTSSEEPKKETTTKPEETTVPESTLEAIDENGTHEIVDHGGNTVVLPNKINRIVIDQIPILSTYMAYFEGEAPYIVGYAGSIKSAISKTPLKDIAPELMNTNDIVMAQSDLNIEEIMKLEPDVIFYNANNKKHKEALAQTGIPLVGFSTIKSSDGSPADPVERYKQWLHLLEDVFQEEGKMTDFIKYGDSIVEEVEASIAEVPENERPTAMTLFKLAKGTPMVSGKGIFGYFWLKRLGVVDKGAEAEGFAKVNFEQIYEWNPDIIFVNGPGLFDVREADILENQIEGVDFSPLKAVQDGRVYDTTLGMWNWFTPNPDAPLVMAWLACKTYPDKFADYPLEDTIKDYYKKFYNYDLSDEELKDILDY